MNLQIYTLIHVLISLTAIVVGFVVVFGLLNAKRLDGWTALFLTMTVLTSVTGFFFPSQRILPSHIVGGISLIVLATAIYARYACKLSGGWCKAYVISAVLAFYLNVFVAIVQAFLKIPALKALAPTQTEPPFKLTQALIFALFVGLAIFAAIRFKPQPTQTNPTK